MDQSTANTFLGLQPLEKVVYPTKTQRKKRFAKIRRVLEGDKNAV